MPKRADKRTATILGPPEGRPWVWVETEMLYSPAWRELSINGRRLIDFLLIEHRNHAGAENGRLKATHRQLEAFGLSVNKIRAAIEECERLGFVRATAQGFEAGRAKRHPTLFRLTFYAGSIDSSLSPPTNEWKAAKIQKSALTTKGNLPSEVRAELPPEVRAAANVVSIKNHRKRNQIKGKAE